VGDGPEGEGPNGEGPVDESQALPAPAAVNNAIAT
jgi:hypothetical protein